MFSCFIFPLFWIHVPDIHIQKSRLQTLAICCPPSSGVLLGDHLCCIALPPLPMLYRTPTLTRAPIHSSSVFFISCVCVWVRVGVCGWVGMWVRLLFSGGSTSPGGSWVPRHSFSDFGPKCRPPGGGMPGCTFPLTINLPSIAQTTGPKKLMAVEHGENGDQSRFNKMMIKERLAPDREIRHRQSYCR